MINGRKIVALCTYRIYDSQVFGFITELNELLRAYGSRLFIYATNTEIGNGGDSMMAETSVFNLIPYDKVDVVVIMDEKIKSRETVQGIIDKANAHNVPSVIIDGEYENTNLVMFDYAKGFEAVVRHVIEHHGIRKPHFMAGKRDSVFSNERIDVFKKVISENGIPYDDSMVSYGDFWSVPSRAAAHRLLERDELPEAVICANDIMAINVCDVFESAGVSVPKQVLVTGFDGIDEAFLSSPGVTTAICDSQILASTVMDVILSVFENEENIVKWITPSFIANESCGCPRCSQDMVSAVHGFNNRFYHHQDDIHIMQNLTSRIMAGENLKECLTYLRNPLLDHMCCIVENACFDLEKNFFLEDIEGGEMSVLYNSYNKFDGIKPYDPKTIIPNFEELLEAGYPLIFNALEYMGKSPGFVCYSYPNYGLIDYSKTPTITNTLGMGIGGYVTMRYQQYLRDKIQKMYQNDALTGLYNRLAFLAKFEELKDEPANSGEKLTLIMVDLNGLKQINDNLGHVAGDQAIATVAKALRDVCPAGSLCVRFGGDEMLALVPGDCDSDDIISNIERRLEKESERLGYTVSASYGSYSTRFNEILDLDRVIGLADEQMYKMKREKKHK